MKRRIAAVVPALAAVAMAVPLALSTPAGAAASCGRTASDTDGSAWDRTANGANERSGSSTGCASNGLAYNTHRLDYHCYTRIGDTSETWTYLRNDNTGKYGWVRDDLLSDGGSVEYCGF
ncbi:SH3 domain-containing protein [Streptomyces sp. NPDC056948]|uniref:SH3 domain-containing protein n=1 Tax=Streptomyces sp. NPDC056948 TaxID=3345975 RepID=UPI0036321932